MYHIVLGGKKCIPASAEELICERMQHMGKESFLILESLIATLSQSISTINAAGLLIDNKMC